MYSDFYVTKSWSYTNRISVKTIYKLFTDSSYLSNHKRIDPQKYIFLYTLEGVGKINIDGTTYTAESNTLIVINAKVSLKYWCAGQEWNFWLFEYKTDQNIIPAIKLQSILLDKTDLMLCGLALEEIKHENVLLATAYFQALYYSAYKKIENSINTYQFEIIDSALSYMRSNLSSFSVSDLCSCLHIEERTFRNIFSEYMKTSPKNILKPSVWKKANDTWKVPTFRFPKLQAALGFRVPATIPQLSGKRITSPLPSIGLRLVCRRTPWAKPNNSTYSEKLTQLY